MYAVIGIFIGIAVLVDVCCVIVGAKSDKKMDELSKKELRKKNTSQNLTKKDEVL